MRLRILWLISISILIISTISVQAQINNKEQLLKASAEYYASLKNFSIIIFDISKTSIAEDTSTSVYYCYFNKDANKTIFSTSGESEIYMVSDKMYSINRVDSSYYQIKSKEKNNTVYLQFFNHLPIIEKGDFFENISKEHLIFKETDDYYLLMNFNKLYKFRKYNYSLACIINTKQDYEHGGTSYKRVELKECRPSDAEYKNQFTISDLMIAGVRNKKNIKKERLSFFNRELLKGPPNNLLNNNIPFPGKLVLLDIFYESCYPCIRSLPLVTDLYENRDSTFIVIGVDSNPRDSLNIKRFLERYAINYPVFIGQTAVAIENSLKISLWPTFVLVDQNGRVLERCEGESESFFKRIKKKYLSK